MDTIHQLIIIGAGPAGISCAIEAKKAGIDYLLIDKGSIANSIQQFQRDMFFFSTPELLEVGNVPFVVPTTRPTSLDCVNYYRRVVEYFGLSLELYRHVVRVENINGVYNVETAQGTIYRSKAIVVATGYYDAPNPLGVPGEELPHVTHFYKDALPFYKQNVVVVGGKNSAVEAALDLYRHGANVTVVHRGESLSQGVKYWILPDFENRVKGGSIKLLLNTIVKEFQPGKTLVQSGKGQIQEITNDFVFILIGYRPEVQFLKSMGIHIDEETLAPVHNPETFETNMPNMFVAGGLVGGKFNNKVFIENGREHGKKIIEALKKRVG